MAPNRFAWKHLIYPDDLQLALDNFNKHIENPDHPRDYVIRFNHKNGSTVWIRCRCYAIRNNDGKAFRILRAHQDITKQKEHEEKYDLLFNSIDEGFCIIEMIFDEQKKPVDYRFLAINTSFEKQTGLHGAVGKRMREFAPNHEERWFEIYGKIALTGEPIRFENRAEQLQRWYDVYAFRFGEPKNFQVGILFNDISGRKQSEEQLLALNKDLEAFSYSVSHDLRAPLRSINGYMTIFSEDYVDKLDDEARRLMNIILSNAKKMGHLIDDLLEFSKLGRRELTRVNVSMKDMVENLWDELKRTEGQREFEFRLDDLPAVEADGISIRQVWTNLISNAIKYTRGNQKASIEIGAREIENEIIYFVKDNGAGFDMRYYDKLFGVFQRLHKPSEFEGTGVGLAIVQRIITKHGGRVWAEAKVNEGATFYFSLSRDKG
jgi:signal transduction histidine kinase